MSGLKMASMSDCVMASMSVLAMAPMSDHVMASMLGLVTDLTRALMLGSMSVSMKEKH